MNKLSQSRQKMRQQRQCLSPTQQAHAAHAILQCITQQRLLAPYQHIGFYYPVHGECDPTPLIELAWQQNKCCYLPILPADGQKTLQFMPYRANQRLIKNRYNIPEPEYDAKTAINAQQLELVFTPLVAFDPQGHRLGMGAGFYDTTFAFTLKTRHHMPLIGLAYEFQCVDNLVPQPWDVPLTAIVTEKQIYWS